MSKKSFFTLLTLVIALLFPVKDAFCATHTIVIEGMKFIPETLTVKANDTVIWVNKDFFPHTATTEKTGFDSGEIKSEASWAYVAKAKGFFTYICTLHPTMKGILKVK